MKVKLTSLVLSILFLWGAVTLSAQQRWIPRSSQMKATSESFCVVIAPTLTYEEQELSDLQTPFVFETVQVGINIWRQSIRYILPFTGRSSRAYILFRVLRN